MTEQKSTPSSADAQQPAEHQGSALDRETKRVDAMMNSKADASKPKGGDDLGRQETILQVEQDARIQKSKAEAQADRKGKDRHEGALNQDG